MRLECLPTQTLCGMRCSKRVFTQESDHGGSTSLELTSNRFPLLEEYEKELKSNVADIRNVSGSKAGGSCTAAAFLKKFVKMPKWMHCGE